MSCPRFCLASSSPRRQEMLTWLGISFHIQPADLDETPYPGEPADEYVWRLAGEKALADASSAQDGELVLAADTTVTADAHILGKPLSPLDAVDMLRRLRGRTHQVHTAVAIYDRGQNRLEKDFCCTDVPMRAYSDEEIDRYVESGDPLDKAGAYAIQHVGFHPVENFTGCFASVMGMPLCHLKRTLRAMGIQLEAEPIKVCLENLSYRCQIHQQVLDGQPGK
ncbi:MAG: nucleoside triphosphate pyrophosphatase [Anaerolineaceae bacterium]